MAASFPVTFPSALTTVPTTTLESASHNDSMHLKDRDEIIAVQTKVGLGSSTASGTTALLGTGGTQSAWGQITDSYIAGTANITASKLATITQSLNVVGTATSPTSTSTSYVDMNEMVGTIITTTGGSLLARLRARMSQAAGGNSMFIALSLNGGAEVADTIATGPSAAYAVTVNTEMLWSVAAGTHVVKGRYHTDGGTVTLGGTMRMLTLQEMRR